MPPQAHQGLNPHAEKLYSSVVPTASIFQNWLPNNFLCETVRMDKDHPNVKYATTYTLTAYDADTGKEVFSWPNVVADQQARPATNAIIAGPSGQQFIVIGVRYYSMAADWRIDVRQVKQ